ncbi:uncharacterized protein LOC34621413 [Cyclospora cayetanensis]|uniref:Uncharacterized protein LOC34621413 n=1 Tax=Cyclospora cayetanensis TaxID=88456 RepID=A0A6P6RWJ0_9EIME|nr:uncharacterized protein LOC34621413 [Cyclospora cayetanensis]
MLLHAELLVALAHPEGALDACGMHASTAAAAAAQQLLREYPVQTVCCCGSELARIPAAATEQQQQQQHGEGKKSNPLRSRDGSDSHTGPTSATGSCGCLHFDSLRLFGEALLRNNLQERLLQQLLVTFRQWTFQDPHLLLLAATCHMEEGNKTGVAACRSLLERTRALWEASPLAHLMQAKLGEALDLLGCVEDALRELQGAFLKNPLRPKLLFLLFGSGVLTTQQEAALLAAADYRHCSWALHLAIALSSAAAQMAPMEFLECVRQQRQQQALSQHREHDETLVVLAACEEELRQLEQQKVQQTDQEQLQERLQYPALAAVACRYPTRLLPPLARLSRALEVLSEGLYAAPVYISCCMQLGRAADLLSLLQRLRQQPAMDALRFYAEGVFLVMQSQHVDAIACFRRSIRRSSGGPLLSPVWAPCHVMLGHCLSLAAPQQQQQAACAYEEAVRVLPGALRPRDPRACYELSLARLRANRVCEALPLARAAAAAAGGRKFVFARHLVSIQLARCLLRKAVLPSCSDEEYIQLLLEAHELLQQHVEAAACRCRDGGSSTCCNGCCTEAHSLLRACRILMGEPGEDAYAEPDGLAGSKILTALGETEAGRGATTGPEAMLQDTSS